MALAFIQKISSSLSDLKYWRSDLMAGFQVALIALPLSLGIAMASGVPPIAGLITAIVGGLVVSRLTGAHVTINGPAAGLIVVILDSVERLGQGDGLRGYQLTLAATVCAGIIQVLFGVFRAGRLSVLFPSAAVHGMMAAIGMIVFCKQFPILLGTKATSPSIFGILGETGDIMHHVNPLVATLGGFGLLGLIFLPYLKWRWIRVVPSPIWAVAFGALLGWAVHLERPGAYSILGHDYSMGPQFYVNLPQSVFSSLRHPDFSGIFSGAFLQSVITIALVASLETLLSAAAVDKIDPEHRKANLNKDLVAVGVGTMVSGALGGLPMIAEIVRSTANVNSGARTSWSNFFHGALLLLAILIFPSLLAKIPLASLAALLVFTGYRLASPKNFLHVKEIGWDQFIIFVMTVVTVLATDLLIGIAAGVVAKAVLHLLRGVHPQDFVKARFKIAEKNMDFVYVTVESALIFSNLMAFFKALEGVASHKEIKIDLTSSPFVDHTSLERLHDFQRSRSLLGASVTIHEHENHERLGEHAMSSRRLKP